MRKLIVFNRVTADGYFSADDGDIDWVVPDEDIDRAGAASMPDTDTMLFGRRTYEQFERFWPTVANVQDSSTAPDPHAPGRHTKTLLAMATWINDMPKLVFSTTRQEVTWKNSRLLPQIEPREIEALKDEPGKNIIIFGSGSVVSQLTQHGLIDEYQFVISPVLLGSGKALISGITQRTRLALLDVKAYDSGNITLRYAPKR